MKRFWSKVNKNTAGGCWEWTASLTRTGYGKFGVNYKTVSAHGFSWELLHGKRTPGICICHRCDNPKCVNPAHLFAGTKKDNSVDMAKKHRSTFGAKNARAKLSDAQVSEIRQLLKADMLLQREIASRFGVGQVQISRIKLCKRWSHTGGLP